ncbi:MAG TPA: R3H domain-containing nucleic acid-binding protein [Candidatus Saccharibacteria bacterium]|jgi:spoIIIJ-associated protein|nr:R3H domain-containing nucleic acid-binding protein [Candidatus Saccharibacteria bacterium]
MSDQDQAIEDARKFLEDILSFFGLNATITASVEEDVIELSVPSTHLNGFLIGQHGDTLRALQAMVSTMLKNKEAALNRVNIDIADYKQHRAEKLLEQLSIWVEKVRETKEPYALQPMNPADRRTIHRGLEDYSDVTSHSEGEARDRHIVLELSEK